MTVELKTCLAPIVRYGLTNNRKWEESLLSNEPTDDWVVGVDLRSSNVSFRRERGKPDDIDIHSPKTPELAR